MIVARHNQDTPMGRGAIGVAMLERIAGPVHARPLAVPQAEYAIDGAFRVAFHPLRAQNLGRSQFLVDGGHEIDARRLDLITLLPDHLIDHAQRRATVAADEASRVQACSLIALALHEHQAQQGLCARHEDRALLAPDVVFQRVIS